MPNARIVDLVFVVVFVLLLTRMLPAALHMARVYFGIRRRRLADGTGKSPPPPPAVAAMAGWLERLGFRRIGERYAILPGNKQVFEWNVVDQATTTYASLVSTPGTRAGLLLGYYSAFSDGAFVATMFPSGASVERPDFLGGAVGTSPEDAYAEHQRRVSAFSQQHGSPLPNRSMADLLRRDDTYRSRHGGITLRNRFYGYLGMVGLVFLAATLSVVRFLAD